MQRVALIALPLTVAAVGVGFSALRGQRIQDEPAKVEFAAEGFEVQHVYEVPLEAHGSWVSLAVGPDGSLFASDQDEAGIYRIRIGGDIDTPQPEVTRVNLDITGAQGLYWAFDHLYANRNGRDESAGLYRMRDDDGDGELDVLEHLGVAVGGGEHGVHDVLLTEDGEGLYVIGGNSSTMGELTASTITNWKEDQLTPRQPDARGHARGRAAPGGFVLRINPDASEVKLVSIGYRNHYGGAVNRHGELFTYDSDLEYDMALPWYRPTRVIHVVSGTDFGWRNGTGKWHPYFEESLPAIADIGPGSPTGVITGTGARFPAEYQNAVFVLDWTYSTIFAIHLTPNGASYTGEVEEFVFGDPLQVTDAVIGQDGHMYFTTGGRGGQGHLWRVVYRGNESTEPAEPLDTPEARAARELRHQLEAFHGQQDATAVETAWPHLSSEDRFVRHAARVAIERQPVDTWAERALTETDPQARITAIVALARNGTPDHRADAIRSLLELDLAALTADEKLAMLRAFAVVFMRLGEPTEAERVQITQALNPLLPDPGQDHRVNVELVRILVHLRADQVTATAMTLIRDRQPPEAPEYWGEARMQRSARYGEYPLAILSNPPPTRVLEYAWILRSHREGWTADLRREYFEFLNYASEFTGGASYPGHLADMTAEALRNTTPQHRLAVAEVTGRTYLDTPDFEITPPQGPGRAWQVQQAVEAVQPRLTGRNFEAGRNLFFATGCASCHRVNEYGSDNGPDLTTLPDRRFNIERILEALIDPDDLVEEQWLASEVTLTDGRQIVGLPIHTGDRVTIRPRDSRQEAVDVAFSEISSIRRLDISAMPPGMINSLNEEELADLVAYLQSAGDPNGEMFARGGERVP